MTRDRIRSFAEEVRSLGAEVVVDAPFGALTTYRVGGRAAALVESTDLETLCEVARIAGRRDVPVLVLGRGSNLLVADEGFDGAVLRLGGSFEEVVVDVDAARAVAGSAALLPVVARRTAAAGLVGFEWAVGVPGTVGGAVRMNAGGHGSDMAATVESVVVVNARSGEVSERTSSEIGFVFRGSALGVDEIVVRAVLRLEPGSAADASARIEEIVKWRRENQPGGQNAGSVFVNPVPGEVPAGRLIDESGLRGFRIGTAEVSTKHANFIQADEGGRAADVLAVMRHVREVVRARSGYSMRSEIRLVGFADGARLEVDQ